MKNIPLVQVIERVVALKMEAIDQIVSELVEPLADVGNPEKLIKKSYAQWTPEDLQLLIKIYGTKEPNPLSNLIFKKEYDKVKQLEEEI